MPDLQPGQMVGQYKIINEVGHGGMASVYKAYQSGMDRYVAIKVLGHQFATNEEFLGRFAQEARVIARLEHPHILPVYDSGQTDSNLPYLVMRYLDAGTLTERMARGPLSLDEIDPIFTQLAEALQYAHEQGVIHRDVKPSNALLDARGNLFLTDFGIAKLVESTAQFTVSGAITGTPSYMSPEQAMGEKVTPQSDQFSLGVVLYEMLTGQVPYSAETPLAVLLKLVHDPLPPLSAVRPDIHPALERVVLKALSKNPADRFPSINDFLEAWKRAVVEASISDDRPATLQIAPEISPSDASTQIFEPEAHKTNPPAPVFEPATQPPAGKKPKKRRIWLWLAICLPILIGLCCVGYMVRDLVQMERTKMSLNRLLPTAVQGVNWQSWAAGNTAYDLTYQNPYLIASGPGGVTLWDTYTGNYRSITSQEGLPGSQVNFTYLDKNDSVWMGTDAGLAHFAGGAPVIFTHTSGLDSDLVTAMTRFGSQLVAGTAASGINGGGVLWYQDGVWNPAMDFPSNLIASSNTVSPNVTSILVDPDEDDILWVGTESGLAQFSESWIVASDLPDGMIMALGEGAEDQLVVVMPDAVYTRTATGFVKLLDAEEFGLSNLSGFVMDQAGQYWFAAAGGILRYSPNSDTTRVYTMERDKLPADTFISASRYGDAYLAFGTEGEGIAIFKSDHFETLELNNLPTIRSFENILPAPDGSLLFSSASGGATRYQPASQTWEAFPWSTGVMLSDTCCVIPLAYDKNGWLWSGGQAGLWILKGDEEYHLTINHDLPSNNVTAVLPMDDDQTLVGTDNGIAILTGREVTMTFDASLVNLASNRITTMLRASDGTAWIGTEGGLTHITADNQWELFRAGKVFSADMGEVTALTEEIDGAIWVATANDGVYRYFHNEWAHFSAESTGGALPAETVTALASAPDGAIWAGTAGGALLRYNGDNWLAPENLQGTKHPAIHALAFDPSGALWIAFEGSVARYIP